MGQEFVIKSQQIEDKINQLLPSQGGFQPGVDFSASTTVIPIIDLTETAEGSTLRQDLQTSLSYTSATTFDVNNTTTTIITTTGYYRVTCGVVMITSSGSRRVNFIINDGLADKIVHALSTDGSSTVMMTSQVFDFNILLTAGDSFKISAQGDAVCRGSVRQIADLSGNLVNP